MPAYQRHQRVESLIQEEISAILLREVEFEGMLVTVTGVAVQKDLDYAIVYFSVIPSEKSKAAEELLIKRQKYLQHLLREKIHIKPMPELRFELDRGQEHAAKVEKAFIEIEKEEKSR